MGSAVSQLLGNSGGSPAATSAPRTYGSVTSRLLQPAPTPVPAPSHGISFSAVGHLLGEIPHAAETAVNATKYAVKVGSKAIAKNIQPAINLAEAIDPDTEVGANKEEALKTATPIVRMGLESTPETESGAAGGGENKAENKQTNAGPSTKSLAVQALIPAVGKGVGKVAESVIARVAASKAAEAATPAVDDVADVLSGKTSQVTSGGATAPSNRVAFDLPTPETSATTNAIVKGQTGTVHKYIGQINKALTDTTRDPSEIAYLNSEKADAQDVLDGKRSFGDVYPNSAGARLTGPTTPGTRITDRPAVLDDLPTVQKGDTTRQAVVNQHAAIANTNDTFHETEMNALAKKMDPADLQLTRTLDDSIDRTPAEADARIVQVSKQAKDPDTFLEYARLQHQDAETVFAHRDALHPGEIGHVGNYQQRFYDTGDKSTAAELEGHSFAIKNGKPGYSQHRTLPAYDTEIPLRDDAGNIVKNAAGDTVTTTLKPRNADPHQDYLDMIHQTASENGSAALIKGLKEAHPGQLTRVGVDPSGRNLGNLKITGAKGYSIGDKKLADFYNRRSPTLLSQTAKEDRTGSQKVQAGVKTTTGAGKSVVTAGGLFHGLKTGISTAGEQLLSIKGNLQHPIERLADNLKLIGSTFSKTAKDSWVRQLSSDQAANLDGKSTLARARVSNLTLGENTVKADTNGRIGNFINNLPVAKQMYEAVFNRQIPMSKLMMFRQATEGLSTQVPGDLAKMRQVATALNRGIGGIDNFTEGMTPKAAAVFDDLLLGRDINEGMVETLAHALHPGPQGNIARKFILGASTVATLPGIAILMATGKIKNPDQLASAFVAQFGNPQIPTPWRTPPTPTNPKGNPLTLKLPTNFVSLVAKIVSPAIDPEGTFEDDRLSGLEQAASARLSVPLAAGEKLLSNKDFYGNPIIGGNDANGNHQGVIKSAENVAEQFAPIPVAQTAKTATGGQNIALSALNVLGLRGSSSTLPQDTLPAVYKNTLYNVYNGKGGLYDQKAAIVKQVNALETSGKQNQAARIAQEWNESLATNKTMAQFQAKYPLYDNATKLKDKNYTELKVSATGSALATRKRDSQSALKIQNLYQ